MFSTDTPPTEIYTLSLHDALPIYPCREEFPHMAELYHQFPRAEFEIAAISGDVDGAKMRAFVKAFDPPFLILDRKSTRLNASHMSIPYAVVCLKKKRHRTPAPYHS